MEKKNIRGEIAMGELNLLKSGSIELSSDMSIIEEGNPAPYYYIDWIASFYTNSAEELKSKIYRNGPNNGHLMYEVEFDFNQNGNFLKVLNALDGKNVVNYVFNFFTKEDIRKFKAFISYMLATFKHETGGVRGENLYRPVEESYFLGIGTEKWKNYLRSKTNYRGKRYPQSHPYAGVPMFYGRGLPQLTHEDNYEKFTEIFKIKIPGFNLDLVKNPELALDFDLSMAISMEGMLEGRFTGASLKKLWKKYSDNLDTFFYECRTIVNSHDQAVQIAEYATDFYSTLIVKET